MLRRFDPHGGHRPLAEVEAMLDQVVASEGGRPDLVQISGGEPCEHPQILDILRAAKARPIRHVMLNTNGVRLAEDRDFVARLARLMPGFEVYLQFDSLRPEVLHRLRGRDLSGIRRRALEALERHNISTTLVAVVRKGVNDDEIGDILRHALEWRCVRGVTLQPAQAAGRGPVDKDRRMLVSDIRRRVIDSGLFGAQDVIPLPCSPESIAIAYGLRDGPRMVPVTGLFPRDILLSAVPNTLTFDAVPGLRERAMAVLSLSAAGRILRRHARRAAVLPAQGGGAGEADL
ncbi:MAG: radical SAM protein [Magnetospirillum sp.]|nr:radical SAM protein [Magnetospirillum sp.]